MRVDKSMMARVAPFAFYIAVMAFSGPLADQGLDVRWLYAIRAGGAAMLLIALRNQYVELYETLAIRWPQLAQAFGAGVMVFLLWINLDSGWMVLEKSAGLDPRDETGQLDYAMVAVRIVGAVLVVPLMEELFWRSFLMRWIDRKDFLNHAPADVSFKALFLTSCVFASAHAHWFAGLVAGIVYGWLYIRTRNLWMPVIAHAITNGILGVWVVHAGRWDFW